VTEDPEPVRIARTPASAEAELSSCPARPGPFLPNVGDEAPHIGGAAGEGTVTSMSEAALRRGRRRPEVEEPAAGMVELDPGLVVRRVSGAFADLFGTTPDDVIGTGFPGWFLPAVQETVRRQLGELVSGAEDRFEERLVGLGPGGGAFFVDVTGRILAADDGGTCLVLLAQPVEPGEPAGVPERLADLDARILEGLAAGEPAVRIAMRLFLSRQAVDYRIGAMLRKLAVPNRAALVSKAYALGLLEQADWPPRVPPHARED
jgi:PAS domain S-box-containing protein